MTKTIIHTDVQLYLPQLPKQLQNLKILHLSDIHSRGINAPERAVLKIAQQGYDLCLITGDNCCELRIPNPLYIAKTLPQKTRRPGLSWYGWHFATKRDCAIEFCKQLVLNLNCPTAPICIAGNHDPMDFFEQLPELGITTLQNESQIFELPNRPAISIVGLYCNRRTTVDIPKALLERQANMFSIALSHFPELAQPLAAANIDLILAGHTHGGQVCTPKETPIVTHSHTGSYLSKGLNFIGKTAIYTSRGLGESLIPIRWNCPPEIVTMTLHQGPTQNSKISTTAL